MTVRNIILLLCIMQLAITAKTQPAHINFTSLTSRDGLLSNSVNAILKDRYGFMWFATDDGLNKFDGANFTVYRHISGDSTSLQANEILALHEDGLGNLWVGTSGGAVSLYDRKKDKFLHFPARGDSSGLLSNAVIRGICSDHEGRIWIAQFESPYVLDPATRRLTKIELGHLAGMSAAGAILNCIFSDSRGRIWVGTEHGLFLYMPAAHSFRQIRYDSSVNAAPLQDHVRTIGEDSYGHLWIGTEGGLCIMRPDDGAFVNYSQPDPGSKALGSLTINAIVPDKDGKLWIGTMEGLYVMDPRTGLAVSWLPDDRNVHGLTSKAIKSIYIDKEGIYWLGTYRGGINKFDKNLNLFDIKLSDAFLDNGSKSSIITSFAEQQDGKIWVGTDGGGLYSFDKRTEALRRISIKVDGKIKQLAVMTLKAARNGNLYVGTYGDGLISLRPSTGRTGHLVMGPGKGQLSGNDIYAIMEDSRGRIWIGTNGQGVNVLQDDKVAFRFTPAPTAAIDVRMSMNGYIRAIEEDRDGNVWIGSHGGGLAVYHPKDGSFTFYNQSNSRLPLDKIYALLCDSRGRMWVGTYGGGLSEFDKTTGQFINYNEKDGLQNTTIYQVVEDTQGRIWVSTNTGISSFDPASKAFRNFTSYNGLQNNNFVHGSGIRLSDGELLFGGLQGFNYFYPAALTVNRNVPAVVLTDLQIANRSVEPGDASPISRHISVADEIRLDYKQNFALSFVALNYTIPRQNHYAYKLEGFDNEWNYSGTTNTARYTNLDPGQYIFRVRASNNDGVWSTEDKTIRIYVKPPFWRTMYAYIFYVLAAGGLLWYSRHRALSKVRKKFILEREQAEVRRARELDRMKLKFLTNLSHEFRTPISLIIGPVDQLLSDQQHERSKDRLQMIRRNARRLLNLVNQLLDFRKMEEQELRLQLAEGELVAFTKDVVCSFADLSERKHITLRFHSDIDHLYVLFDHDKIERILFNLLSNAFKFTLEHGEITVALQGAGKPSDGTVWVIFRVMDTGIGIPDDQRQRIFDRFFQHASPDVAITQGTGIGLSITKEFVRMHGGAIDVESQVGRGSAFTVNLPLQILAHQAQADPELPDPPSGNRAATESTVAGAELPTILLVEDNEDFRFYLKDNLKQYYRIIEAEDGKEGWQKALSGHPQLIVSDITMPHMDGITLAKKLKADKRTSHIPIILLTALTEETQQLQGLGTGANDYITKPFNFEVLHARMMNLLALSRNLQTTYTRQIKVLAPDIEVETEDERLLQNIVRCLEEHITDPKLSVEFLSRKVGMSRSSLYTKVLEITGETPVEYIRSFKLEKAAVLLERTDLTIAEVAYHTGFTTPNYFARAFKAKFNALPSEFVAQKRKVRENDGT